MRERWVHVNRRCLLVCQAVVAIHPLARRPVVHTATWAERRLRPSSYEDASRAMREPRYRWEMWGAVFCLGICHRHHVSSVAGRHNTGQISSLRLQVHRRRHPVQFPTYGLSEDHLIHSHLLKALVRSQYSNLWPVVDSHHDLTPARWLVW